MISFSHKYQTDSTHDGGIVEFSFDSGATWQNVMGACTDSSYMNGIHTENFYSSNDTLISGEPAFMGTQNTLQYSIVQFFAPLGGSVCSIPSVWPAIAFLRFRFVSDSIPDSLAGWIIDSIKMEHYFYPDFISKINKPQSLNTYPNPSYDGIFTFPPLNDQQEYTTEVYNAIGQRILNYPYNQSLDLSQYPKGLYFYKVTSETNYYTGQLLLE
jgi:hypothetical protein